MFGAELMARAVERQGVKTVFGLPGHLEAFFGALQERNIRLIHQRHESAVVLSADGCARVRRSIGVACVTAGPGLANALGGLASAYMACTPLLVFCGRNEFRVAEIGALQEMDHTSAARPIAKSVLTVHEASRLGEYVDMACRVALSGRPGPVLLEVPRNLPLERVDEDIAAPSLRPLIRPARPLADPAAVARAVDVLMEAERPLILAGNGAYWGEATEGLRRLAGEFRLPVFANALARGIVPEDMEVGFPWPMASPAAREADVVLVAGKRMDFTIGFAAPPFFAKDARFIQIDVDGAEIGRNQPVAAPIVADCGPALAAIGVELARREYQPRDPAWAVEALRDRLARIDELGREQTGMVHPLRMARELAQRMPPDAIYVSDGANCTNWFKAVLRVMRSPGWMDHDPFGSMGVGLPLAIGAAAAEQESASPRPVFLGAGDGALGQYLAELATASLHGLPLFIMLANNGAWGASRGITLRTFGGTYGVEMNQSRYDLVAQGLECHGELATSPEEVGPAFDRALAAVRHGKPALVNVLVDREVDGQRGDPLVQMVPFNPQWPPRAAV